MGVFHLLRHGEHGLLGRVLAGRMPGVGMTERGRAEIAAQAERLAGDKVAAIPGGESMRAVQQRVVAALLELNERHLHEIVVLVSHGDVIRAVLLFALGMPLDFYNRIEIAQGSISTIRLDASGIRVLTLSERPRLP